MDASCSIIIPTANRPNELQRLLTSLAPYARNERRLEILVIDGGAPAETSEVVRRYAMLYPLARYVFEPAPGRLSGRHRGALEARGDILIYLDDDVEVAPGWFYAIMAAFGDETVSVVGGPSLPRYAEAPPDWLDVLVSQERRHWRLPLLSLIDLGPRVQAVDATLIQGLNFAVRRQAVFDHGGFHPDRLPPALQRFQGDGEHSLAERIQRGGGRAVYHPGARVHHHIPVGRLTIEHFEHCAARRGAADSYTALRRANGLLPPERQHWWHLPTYRIPAAGSGVTTARFVFSDVRRRIAAAYRSGYSVHQQEAARDPVLRQWVLRPEYWDYRLPPTVQHRPAAAHELMAVVEDVPVGGVS